MRGRLKFLISFKHGRQSLPVILLISSFLYLETTSPALSADPVSIAVVFSSSEYHMKTVTLKGTVTQVRPVPPHFSQFGESRVEGSYTFTLEDSTGTIEAEVPRQVFPPPSTRDCRGRPYCDGRLDPQI
jgi:hypothetical protein